MSDAIFLLILVCAIASIGVAWWRFRKVRRSLATAQTKKTLVGLLANTVAFVLPFAYAFLSLVSLSTLHQALPVQWDYILVSCWVLCLVSLVMGLIGPKQVRLPLLLGSLTVAAFWTMVPVGIL